jgi:hypothetical protein
MTQKISSTFSWYVFYFYFYFLIDFYFFDKYFLINYFVPFLDEEVCSKI